MLTVQTGARVAELFDPAAWTSWIAGLDRGFAFLLLLPFVVALVGLWASWTGEEERGRAAGEGEEDER